MHGTGTPQYCDGFHFCLIAKSKAADVTVICNPCAKTNSRFFHFLSNFFEVLYGNPEVVERLYASLMAQGKPFGLFEIGHRV
jgi:hypothetical protein